MAPGNPGHPAVTKVADKSAPTPNGYYWMFSKREKPYSIYKVGEEKAMGILCECKSKADAELKIASYERDHVAPPQPDRGHFVGDMEQVRASGLKESSPASRTCWSKVISIRLL